MATAPFPVTPLPEGRSADGPGRNATAALLAFVLCSSFFCRLTVSPLQEPLQGALRLSDDQVALVQGMAMALPAVIGGVPVGLMVDRFNRAKLLLVFTALNLIGTLLTALSIDFTMLVLARAVVGFSTAAAAITVPSLLADLFTRGQRGRVGMINGVAQILGMAAAFATGGMLVSIFRASEVWRTATLTMSGPLLVAVLLCLVLREQPRMEMALERPTLASSMTEFWSFRGILAPLLTGVIVVGAADGAALVWVVPALSRSFGLSTANADAIMSIALLVGGVLGPIIGGFATDRCLRSGEGGAARAMTLLALLAALSGVLGLFALAPGWPAASICLTLFLVAGCMVVAVSLTLITVLLPNELRGFCFSVLSAVQILFDTGVAPSLVSSAAARIGGQGGIGVALAIVCGAAGAVSAASFLIGRAYLRRRPPLFEPVAVGAAVN